MKTNLFAFVGYSVVASTLSVSAQSSPFYVRGDLGGTLTDKADLKEFFGPVAPGSQIKFDPGIRFGITGGYQVTDWLGVEATTGILGSKVESITDATTLHDVYLSNIPLQGGVRLQWPHLGRITPFVGGSAGGSVSVLDADHLTIGGTYIHGSGSDVTFAWQAFGGVQYELNQHMDLSLEYHFFADNDSEWHSDDVSGTPSNKFRIGGVDIHAITFAFQYRF
jgi:opacity protein-like surface antigen